MLALVFDMFRDPSTNMCVVIPQQLIDTTDDKTRDATGDNTDDTSRDS